MTTWPWPRDSREDRARRVALSYRNLCADNNIDTSQLDQHWDNLGQTWVTPKELPDLDAWIPEAEAAQLFSQPAKTIYDWGRRHHIRVLHTPEGRRVNIGDIIDYSKRRRKRTG